MPESGAPRNGTRKAKARGVRANGRSAPVKGGAVPPSARVSMGGWIDTLTRQTQEHPGRTVALAVGAGFVLGGGLFSRLSMRVAGAGLRIALRAAMVPAIRQGVVALAGDFLMKTADGAPAASAEPAEPASARVASQDRGGIT